MHTQMTVQCSCDFVQVYYSNISHNQSKQVVNDDNFNGAYTLDGLRPYTEYSVYVTAVRLIGDTGRPLEGMKSRTVTGRTLAGGKMMSWSIEVKIV